MNPLPMQPVRTAFKSTREGLDWQAYPMRLFQKAKKWGIWDPQSFDFSQDRKDWQALAPDEQRLFLQLTAQFVAGEESVTLDLLPLVRYMAEEGRLEDEMYLTSFLWEEAKHVEAFARFLDEVVGVPAQELEVFLTPAYRKHFMEVQPRAMARLNTDRSPEALAEASIAYNMITEGVLAETGYFAYYTVMDRRKMMPGMHEMIQHIQRDESRHIGYGVYLLSRLIAEHGEDMWVFIQTRMGEMLPTALEDINQIFDAYDPVPFDLTRELFLDYAMGQFIKRVERLAKALEQKPSEVDRGEDFVV